MIFAEYKPAHFNVNCNANIPAYWTPIVWPLETNCTVWPCETKDEAIALGEQMVADGIAEAP
jgi:hypothetical protein